MKFIQLSIFIGHNSPGALNDACQVLAKSNIDLSTLTLADTKEFGILRLITKDWEKAKMLLSEAGFMVQTTEVVALLVDHKPGGMCGILDTLARNNINVEYLYAFATPIAGNAVVASGSMTALKSPLVEINDFVSFVHITVKTYLLSFV